MAQSHIFYHSADLDGRCSGAIAALWHERRGRRYQLHPFNYGDPFPWDDVAGESVWMLDVSLQPYEEMRRLAGHADVVWIDHHVTAIEGTQALGVAFEGIQQSGRAACQLAWDWCFSPPEPVAVGWLGRYDVWDRGDDWDETILPFQYAMRARPNDPARDGMDLWRSLLIPEARVTGEPTAGDIALEGMPILQYLQRLDGEYARAYGREIEAFGYPALACNRGMISSQFFQAVVDPQRHALLIGYVWAGHEWKVTLYAVDPSVSCGAIARRYGGGGHAGAAGFSCATLPWEHEGGRR